MNNTTLDPQNVMADMRQRLEKTLSPSHLEILDEGAQHVGHAGARTGKGHYAVIIASPTFEGKNPVQQHQLIYKALGNLMTDAIHALRIAIK
ncbi:MAG: BolA family protein [Gammaproteobacteria bacterium]